MHRSARTSWASRYPCARSDLFDQLNGLYLSRHIARPAGVQGARSDRAGTPDRAVLDDQEALLCITHCKTQSIPENRTELDRMLHRCDSINPAHPDDALDRISRTPRTLRLARTHRVRNRTRANESMST